MSIFDIAKKMGDIKSRVEQLHLEDVVATGESGGGLVKVTLNGRMEMVDIFLDPIVVDNPDVKMLQDLIVGAHNAASMSVMEAVKEKLGTELGVLGLAGLPL